MALVYANMKLSEVVEENTSLIPVIHRFGIRLGLGDDSVQAICANYQIDPDFFLAIVNTFLNEDYFPEKKLQGFHLTLIINYLTRTNHYYQRHQLPNIERHLRSFIAASDPDNTTPMLIGKLFDSFKEKLTTRIRHDEKTWFPYCLSLTTASPLSALLDATYTDEADDATEALLTDLQHIMVKHLTGEYDENLCYGVIFSLDTLGRDMRQHNRIRFRILQPIVANLVASAANR